MARRESGALEIHVVRATHYGNMRTVKTFLEKAGAHALQQQCTRTAQGLRDSARVSTVVKNQLDPAWTEGTSYFVESITVEIKGHELKLFLQILPDMSTDELETLAVVLDATFEGNREVARQMVEKLRKEANGS